MGDTPVWERHGLGRRRWRLARDEDHGFWPDETEPMHGFAAETAAASAITVATSMGVPLGTNHTINTAFMGVGASRRLSAVRWSLSGNIVAAWLLTFPICFSVSAVFVLIFRWLF